MGRGAVADLYVHFPFCRRKCTYCALHSRAGSAKEARDAYAASLAERIPEVAHLFAAPLSSVYFGGGTPALCNLAPLFAALKPYIGADTEWTVELHPLDVDKARLEDFAAAGVNRLSIGVQSLDPATLDRMGRGYGPDFAAGAAALARSVVPNTGIDLIAGYPGDPCILPEGWPVVHCSVYSLMVEEKSVFGRRVAAGKETPPDDAKALDSVARFAKYLEASGLERYEISNYAKPGFECRHNLAVWSGRDYVGLGEGAHGRIGLVRTRNFGTELCDEERVSEDFDAKERRIFSLRTSRGLDTAGFPEWEAPLAKFAEEGLVVGNNGVFRLTARGAEVCDTILAELV